MVIQSGDSEGSINLQVLFPFCTGVVFNLVWLVVRSVFRDFMTRRADMSQLVMMSPLPAAGGQEVLL